MKYNGIELKEFTEPQAFNPPKEMVVWDIDTDPVIKKVYAIGPSLLEYPVRTLNGDDDLPFKHCAEIPKPRRATWKELAYWLIDGKGLVLDENRGKVDTGVIFGKEDLDVELSDYIKVIRRDDTDWHEPTVDYMGLVEEVHK